MPTLPLDPEPDPGARAEIVRAAVAVINTAGADRVGIRAFVLIIVAAIAVITNPILPLAVLGGIALIVLATDLSRRHK